MRQALGRTGAGTLELSPSGEILRADPRFVTWLRADLESQLVGTSVFDALEGLHRRAMHAALSRARLGEYAEVDLEIPSVDGPQALTLTLAPVEVADQPLERVVAIGRPSDDAQASAPGLATAAPPAAPNHRLVASAAEQLREPLTYIRPHLARVAAALPPNTDLSDLLTEIRAGVDRVDSLTRDLQQLTSLSSDAVARPVDIHDVLDLAIRLSRRELPGYLRITRAYGADLPPVRADPSRLSQAFVNLIHEAARAVASRGSKRGHEICVGTRRLTSSREVCVEIRDAAPGVLGAEQDRVSQPPSTTQPTGAATGLGIAIAKSIVEGYGGSITLEDTPTGGTVARVTLADYIANDSASRRIVSSSPRIERSSRARLRRKMRLLVVDQDAGVAERVEKALSSHLVVCARDARQALKAVARDSFDAILCDLHLPGMSAFELYDFLAERFAPAHEQVVFMEAGDADERTRTFLAKAGAPRLDKPLDIGALEETLESLSDPPLSGASSAPGRDAV